MDKVKIVLLALLFATPALAQQPSRVSNMPLASIPFNGSEYVYMIQNGISKKLSASQLQTQETFSPLTGLLYGNGSSLPITSVTPGTGVITALGQSVVGSGGEVLSSVISGSGVQAALGQPVTGTGGIVLGTAPSMTNISISGTDPLTLLPTSGTLDPGLTITQTAAGTSAGHVYLNPVTINVGNVSTPGHYVWSFGPTCNENTTGEVGYIFCNTATMNITQLNNSSTGFDAGGAAMFAYAEISAPTTNPVGTVEGINENCQDTSTTFPGLLVCNEIDVTVTASSPGVKEGLRISQASNDAYQGTTYDDGIHLLNQAGAVGWKNGINIEADALSSGARAYVSPGFTVLATGTVFITPASTTNPSANSELVLNSSTTLGGIIQGQGTSYDVSLGTRGGGVALGVITNTANVATGGTLSVNGTTQTTGVIATAVAPTVSASQVGYGGTVTANTNCGTLATSAGCLVINVAGTTHYVPYY